MGDANHLQRLQAPIRTHTPDVQGSDLLSRQRAGSSGTTGGNPLPVIKKGNKRSASGKDTRRFLLSIFPGSEKERGSKTHIGPESSKPISQSLQIQDVDKRYITQHGAQTELAMQPRSPRCLLPHSNIPATQKVSEVRIPGENIRVHGSSIRSLPESSGVCQMHTGCPSSAETAGVQDRQLYRRLASNGRLGDDSSRSDQRGDQSHHGARFHSQLRQERVSPHSVDYLLRHGIGHGLIQSPSVRREGDIFSVMPGPFPSGEQGPIQVVPTSIGPDGFGYSAHSIGQAPNAPISTMGGGARDSPSASSTRPRDSDSRLYSSATSLGQSPIPVRRSCHGNGGVQESDYHGREPDRLGSHSRRESGERHLGVQPEECSYKLSGTDGSVFGPKTLLTISPTQSRIGQVRQHDDYIIYQQTRRTSVSTATYVSSQTNIMEQRSSVISQSFSYPGDRESRGRSNVSGGLPICGVVSPPGGNNANMGTFWAPTSRPLRVDRECQVSSLLLDEEYVLPRNRCAGTQVASDTTVCVSSSDFDHPYARESAPAEAVGHSHSPAVGPLGGGHSPAPPRRTVATATTQRSSVTSTGADIPPSSGTSGSMGLARERLNLNTLGLPHSVIDTIQSARAQSTRTAYDGKWRVFEEWCDKSHITAFQASIKDILSFLQDLLDKGRAASTLKVYLAAIGACHIGFDNKSVGHHPIVARFMKGARKKSRVSKPRAPPWDLALVLDALCQPPFEPLGRMDMKMLTLKTALLVALATAKRVSDIQALSVHPDCTRFSENDHKVSIMVNPSFVPKNPLLECVPILLEAFHPPPFTTQEQERLHFLCPVRALKAYIDRSAPLRTSDQLFVSWVKPHKSISKQRLSHWIVEAIVLAYTSMGKVPPAELRAHSTRGMATSWALFKGVSVQDICAAASWATPSTFARFYRLDVTAPPLAHAVLGVSSV